MRWIVVSKRTGKVLGYYLEKDLADEHANYVNTHGGRAEVKEYKHD